MLSNTLDTGIKFENKNKYYQRGQNKQQYNRNRNYAQKNTQYAKSFPDQRYQDHIANQNIKNTYKPYIPGYEKRHWQNNNGSRGRPYPNNSKHYNRSSPKGRSKKNYNNVPNPSKTGEINSNSFSENVDHCCDIRYKTETNSDDKITELDNEFKKINIKSDQSLENDQKNSESKVCVF